MGENQIGLAVVVEVGTCEAAAEAFLVKEDTGLGGDFSEARLALAHEKPRFLFEGVAEDFASVASNVAVGNSEIELTVQVCVQGDRTERQAVGPPCDQTG